jgi:FtsP/CotA-like multicopper oxidase with cupredoxin domain
MRTTIRIAALLAAGAAAMPPAATAKVLGITSTTNTFNLTAKADVISTSDGDSMWMWGYANDPGRMQYPGPTIIVNAGATVRINLRNQLPIPVSMVFPGQNNVRASGGVQGLLTREVPAAAPGATTGTVTYIFLTAQPGTYLYYSGSRSDLAVEMGLVGALIVRPVSGGAVATNQAYTDPSTAFDQEYLFLVTEADFDIHQQVAFGNLAVDTTKRHPVDWFINGRNFPDTLADANVSYLPTQPYNCAPLIHPNDRVLIRWVSAGADLHPFHTHGQNHLVIARDGRLLKTSASASPDLAVSDYTTTVVPGETTDAIWGPWTGARLGWDVYGTNDVNRHSCNGSFDAPSAGFDPTTHEYCPDHTKPMPVTMPSQSDLTFGVVGGGMWGGTPFLGVPGDLPPIGPGGQAQYNYVGGNTAGGISFMWHSHAERELTTNNIFLGGMAAMALIVPVGVTIP